MVTLGDDIMLMLALEVLVLALVVLVVVLNEEDASIVVGTKNGRCCDKTIIR